MTKNRSFGVEADVVQHAHLLGAVAGGSVPHRGLRAARARLVQRRRRHLAQTLTAVVVKIPLRAAHAPLQRPSLLRAARQEVVPRLRRRPRTPAVLVHVGHETELRGPAVELGMKTSRRRSGGAERAGVVDPHLDIVALQEHLAAGLDGCYTLCLDEQSHGRSAQHPVESANSHAPLLRVEMDLRAQRRARSKPDAVAPRAHQTSTGTADALSRREDIGPARLITRLDTRRDGGRRRSVTPT